MSKLLLFDKEARIKLLAGAKTLADAVTTTLGPKGNNVALDRPWGSPAVVHDGVSVAKDIDLPDPFENIGSKLIKQAATQTGDNVGDGTTTSILLTYELFKKGVEKINKGHNPMMMRRGIESMSEKVLAEITRKSQPVKSQEDLVRISTISAGDIEIGSKIAEAIEKVGANGLVTVETSPTDGITIDYKDGMQFNSGYVTALFANNVKTMNCEMEDVNILLVDQKISSIADIKSLEPFIKSGKKLLLIVSDIEGDALDTLVFTKVKANFQCVVVKAPGFGENQREMLTDLSHLVDGIVLSEESGREMKSLSPNFEEMGHADKIIVDRDTCQIIGGLGSKELIDERISQIKARIETSTSDFEKNRLSERLAKLTGGVAILKVGAPSESEMTEKTERAKDALEATKAAMEEGIVGGGGVTLYNIGQSFITSRPSLPNVSGDFAAGEQIVIDVLSEPIKKLLANAGEENIEEKLKELILDGQGFNIETGEMVDVIDAGIIDPTKVAKLSFKNAISTSISLLTTKCIITDKPEPKFGQSDSDAIY